MAHPTEKQIY
jgi:hypothetical protein